MADSPRQVNAAQIAARKIAQGRKPRRIDRSDQSAAKSVPLFAPIPGNNGNNNFGGGALFGGSVQATGSFDFTAPGPGNGLSWGSSGPSIFSPTPSKANGFPPTEDDDPRADTTGEEAARRNKPFQVEFKKPEQAAPQSFNNPFQPTPQSTLNQGAPPDLGKSNPFSFGGGSTPQSPLPTSTFSFGATPATTQAQPGNNPFAFGSQNLQQQAPPKPSFSFGTPPPENKSAPSIFSFGQTQAQSQPATSEVKFGSTPAPTSSLFSFGQPPSQPQSSGPSPNFESTPAPVQPTNIFGHSAAAPSPSIFASSQPQAPTPVLNLFGQSNPQSPNSSSLFSTTTSTAPAVNNIFGTQSQVQPSTPVTSVFGISGQKPTAAEAPSSGNGGGPTHNIFGVLSQPARSESPSNPFENARESKENTPPINPFFTKPPAPSDSTKENTAPSSSIFGTPKPANNIFGGLAQNTTGSNTDAPLSNSIFGSPVPQANTPANLFAHLNQPAPQGVNSAVQSAPTIDSAPVVEAPSSPRPAPATLQNASPSKTDTSSSIFGQNSFFDSNNAQKASNSVMPSIERDDSSNSKTDSTSLFQSASQSSSTNLLSATKPYDSQEAAKQLAPNGLFSSLSQPPATPSTANNIFSKQDASQNSLSENSSQTLTHGDVPAMTRKSQALQSYFTEKGEVPDSVIESEVPPHFNEEQRIQFYAAYRVRALNKVVKEIIDKAGIGMNFEPILEHYKVRRDDINQACHTGLKNLKRRRGEPVSDDEVEVPAKRTKISKSVNLDEHLIQPVPLEEPKRVANGGSTSPEKQQPSRNNLSPTKSQPLLNGSTTPKAPPPTPRLFPPPNDAPVSPSPKGKRKAEVQITQLDPEGESAEKQSQKLPKLNGSTGSQTSNIFKNILDKPAEPPASTSPKRIIGLPKSGDSEKPRSNPFAKLELPAQSTNSTPLSAAKPSPFGGSATAVVKPSPFGPAAVPTASSSLFGDKAATPSLNMFSKPASTPIAAPNNTFGAQSGRPSSGIFSQSGSAPVAAPSNPFATKTGSTSSSIFSQPASSSSLNIFGSKPTTAPAVSSPLAKTPSTATDVTAKDPPASPIRPPTFGSAATTTPAASGPIKPPTFGTPVNFLAQFGKQAEKSAADRENEEMEKAKMEDMDSDEDEAEWETKYKEKRKAQQKELNEIAKNGKRFTIGNTSKATETPSDKAKSPPKSIFEKPASSSVSGNSLFTSVNRSGTSSPGPTSSPASSIFDGLSSSKPAPFDGNIFGHLSDVDSGADSGKGNEADDDTNESESEADEDDEADNEKKDATYDPKAEEAVASDTPGTPGTPVEETGPGIASTKKPKNQFQFGAPPSEPSNSGTSTPSGSLFDRITKDANGNPVRHLPTEDKENAGPSTASIFGSNAGSTGSIFNFSKSAITDTTNSPGDKTWKPDTPIKFGASAAPSAFSFGSPTTTPAVNVQAPTPTKTSPFGALFGSTTPNPTTGSLFGNLGAAKPVASMFSNLGNPDAKTTGINFGFGGPSTTTSSLFPSAAGSGVTSRATSPGGTTDGDSTNDAAGGEETQAEEQIDLSSGGAGEENEDSMFQVRAKVTKYEVPKGGGDKAWVVKGVGNLKVLKHKESGGSRLLIRTDPSGVVVLNKRILPATYSATQKTVKIMTSDDTGKGLETWLLQVKTPELATDLAEALEKHKGSGGT